MLAKAFVAEILEMGHCNTVEIDRVLGLES
jgi:hypothetical protein